MFIPFPVCPTATPSGLDKCRILSRRMHMISKFDSKLQVSLPLLRDESWELDWPAVGYMEGVEAHAPDSGW